MSSSYLPAYHHSLLTSHIGPCATHWTLQRPRPQARIPSRNRRNSPSSTVPPLSSPPTSSPSKTRRSQTQTCSSPSSPPTLTPSLEIRADITGTRHHHHPPTRVLSAPPSMIVSSLPPPATVALPIVPLQVPHAPSITLLLLCALGMHVNPSALAAALLPLRRGGVSLDCYDGPSNGSALSAKMMPAKLGAAEAALDRWRGKLHALQSGTCKIRHHPLLVLSTQPPKALANASYHLP